MKNASKILIITLILALSGSIYVWAGEVTGLTEFQSNTPALASEVNGNFTAVKTAVDDNNAAITENSSNIVTNAGNIKTNSRDIAANKAAISSMSGESYMVAGAYIGSTNRDTVTTKIYNNYNVSNCTWNASEQRFEITITGEEYYYTNYVTIVTCSGNNYIPRTGSMSDKLLVYLSDLDGNSQPGSFQFVTYKFK